MSSHRPPLAFTGYPFSRAAHLRKATDFLRMAMQAHETRFIVFDDEGQVLAAAPKTKPAIGWLPGSFMKLPPSAFSDVFFLGLADEKAVFALKPPTALNVQRWIVGKDYAFVSPRALAARLSPEDTAVMGTALCLLNWHRSHPYCAKCRNPNPTVITEGGWKRNCGHCQTEHFPRVDPVAIMLPVRDDQVLLSRGARFPPNLFSALAGYIEPGETPEEACAREMMEEVGLKVRSAKLVTCQPWPFPNNLMIGMIAEVDDGDFKLDEDEIVEAKWFKRAEIQARLAAPRDDVHLPPEVAIAHFLLKTWADGK